MKRKKIKDKIITFKSVNIVGSPMPTSTAERLSIYDGCCRAVCLYLVACGIDITSVKLEFTAEEPSYGPAKEN